MKGNRAYRARSVKKVNWKEVVGGRGRQAVCVGVDIGKRAILGVVRWQNGRFERPWLVKNPEEIGEFIALLVEMGRGGG